jgi:phospholipase/carboxylesterase
VRRARSGLAGGSPAGALVLLHGRGSDERDLVPLLDALDPDARLVGVTLRAPLELAPGAYFWYVVRRLGHPDPPTFLSTLTQVGDWLDHELPRVTGVGLERTVLGGFSQGTVLCHALALGKGRPLLAGLLAFSGFIPQAPGFELDLPAHRALPVAIGHGSHDGVIPPEFGRQAAELLTGAGFAVLHRESPMFHSIDPAFVSELSRWIPHLLEQRRAA